MHLHACPAIIKNYMEKILTYQNSVIYEINISRDNKIIRSHVRKAMYILERFDFGTVERTKSKRKSFKFVKCSPLALDTPTVRAILLELNWPFRIILTIYETWAN